jgi:hypothetical protein
MARLRDPLGPTSALCVSLLAGLGACSPHSLGSYGPMAHNAHAGDAAPEQPDGKTGSHDAGQDAAEPDCADASDCDDGDACNGQFTCRAGTCQQVAPPCVNPNPDHCDVQCEPATGACTVSAKDADGDGHGAATCTEAGAQADDCDDQSAAAHPGLPEICDGLDNDCNGQVDLEDGLALSGANVRVALGLMPVLSSSSQNTFGAAYANGGGKVIFHSFTHTGDDLLGALQIVPMDVQSEQVVPSLAWGENSFGLVWSRNGAVRFLELGLTGVAVNQDAANNQEKLNVNPDGVTASWANVAYGGAGAWLVFYQSSDPDQLSLRRVRAAGMDDPLRVASGKLQESPAVLATSDAVAGVWTRSQGSTELAEWSTALEPLAAPDPLAWPLQMSTGLSKVSSAVIAKSTRGYGLAWSVSSSFGGGDALRFAEFDEQGKVLCAAFDLETAKKGARSALVPRSMIATERGYLISGFSLHDQATSVDLVEVSTDHGCRYSQRVQVAEKSSRNSAIAQAQSGEILLLWDAPDSGDEPYIFKRALPATLCTP